MPNTVRFAHVSLSCKDPIAIEKFYSKHFGFRRARVIPLGDQQIVFAKNDAGVYLEIFQAEGGPNPEKPFTGDGAHYDCIRHIAFQVDDVDAKVAEMGADAKVTLGPMGFDAFIPGWKTVWVADPEGNIVEISQGYVDQDNPPALA